ncbi:MAG: diaminopimelate epimerase [Myxococcota bacterium]
MKWFKAHGLGNDYLVAVEASALTAPRVRALCDRHRGIGSDGILEPMSTERADHGVRIWNPDGSVAEKSGNGLRIYAYWLSRDREAGTRFTVDTGVDVVDCLVEGTQVTIEMGVATQGPWVDHRLPTSALGSADPRVLHVTEVRIGNPHVVVWDPGPFDEVPWRAWGAAIERHPHFPNRTNVQFVEPRPGGAELRIWERGAGETQASGSSACAVAFVAANRGHQSWDRPQTLSMPGGVLHVTVRSSGAVVLRGPVAPVGTMTLDLQYQGDANDVRGSGEPR